MVKRKGRLAETDPAWQTIPEIICGADHGERTNGE